MDEQIFEQLREVQDSGVIRLGWVIVDDATLDMGLPDLREWMWGHNHIEYWQMVNGPYPEWLEAQEEL